MTSHAGRFAFSSTAVLLASAVAACSGTTSSPLPQSQAQAATRVQNGAGPRKPVPHGVEYTAGITPNSLPRGITSGPNGMWFTQPGSNQIGHITAAGIVTEFTAPANGVNNIVQGADGNLWFTQSGADAIGRITPRGRITMFSTGNEAYGPFDITAGSDGNLWFTFRSPSINAIGRITIGGAVTLFTNGLSPGDVAVHDITKGPDGNVWFTEEFGNRIGSITPAGAITEYSNGISTGAGLVDITSGADGNLWFTENSLNKVGRITTGGSVTEFSSGISPNAAPGAIAQSQGAVWFTEVNANNVGRVTPSGQITEYPIPAQLPSHALFKWFGKLFREPAVSVVTLPRFEAPELERLMALAVEDRVSLSTPVLHAVRDRSDGNPLFAEELLRNAVDAQRVGLADSVRALPVSIHALIAERLQACSSEERAVLREASLFGRNFRIEHLCEIFGGDAALLAPVFDRLCELQMVDALDGARGDYRFRHALTREIVYAEIPSEVASGLHETIAQHLQRQGGAGAAPEMLGHHFWEAGRADEAAGYYESAGDAAMAVFAYDDAAEFYQRAAAGFASDRAACARALAGAARALIFAGELGGGLDLYERAVTLELELGEIAHVVRNRVLMAGHIFDGGRRTTAIDLLRATLPLAQRGDAALQARLQTRLAMSLARDGRLDEAWSALQAIAVADLNPNAAPTGEYFLCGSELHALRSEPQTWQGCFAEGVAIFEALGHPGPIHVAHANFAVQALSIGEMALAREHCTIAAELAQTLRFAGQDVMQAQLELYAGNLAEARRIVAAMAPSRRFLTRAMLAQVALPLAIAMGDNELLDAHFDESLILDAGSQPFTTTLARAAAGYAMALAAKNRRREARALLARVLASLDTAFGMSLPVMAIATLLPDRAAELHPLLQAAADPPGDRVNKALLALLDGGTAALDGAQRFAAIGWPLFEALCLEIAGRRQAALAIYRRCGAAADVRRLEFGPCGGEEGSALGILTVRERELALQVALGKPNRAVAISLSIGEKAVEKYLTSIYAKLGLTSRAQLAALVAASQSRSE